MRPPIGAAQLILNQGVGGGRVGNAQECFGEAEQHHALGAGDAIFLEKLLDAAAGLDRCLHGGDQFAREGGDAVALIG